MCFSYDVPPLISLVALSTLVLSIEQRVLQGSGLKGGLASHWFPWRPGVITESALVLLSAPRNHLKGTSTDRLDTLFHTEPRVTTARPSGRSIYSALDKNGSVIPRAILTPSCSCKSYLQELTVPQSQTVCVWVCLQLQARVWPAVASSLLWATCPSLQQVQVLLLLLLRGFISVRDSPHGPSTHLVSDLMIWWLPVAQHLSGTWV